MKKIIITLVGIMMISLTYFHLRTKAQSVDATELALSMMDAYAAWAGNYIMYSDNTDLNIYDNPNRPHVVKGTKLAVGDYVQIDGWQWVRIISPGRGKDWFGLISIDPSTGPAYYSDGPYTRITDRIPVDPNDTDPMQLYLDPDAGAGPWTYDPETGLPNGDP